MLLAIKFGLGTLNSVEIKLYGVTWVTLQLLVILGLSTVMVFGGEPLQKAWQSSLVILRQVKLQVKKAPMLPC